MATSTQSGGRRVRCPKCGRETQPLKTWHLTSPLPDARGRIAITIMGSFKCPSCGHGWRSRVGVVRVGGEHDVELEGGRGRSIERGEAPEGRGKVIEVDISDILSGEG